MLTDVQFGHLFLVCINNLSSHDHLFTFTFLGPPDFGQSCHVCPLVNTSAHIKLLATADPIAPILMSLLLSQILGLTVTTVLSRQTTLEGG